MNLTNKQKLDLIKDVAIIKTRVECLPALQEKVNKNTIFRYVMIGICIIMVGSIGIIYKVININKIIQSSVASTKLINNTRLIK